MFNYQAWTNMYIYSAGKRNAASIATKTWTTVGKKWNKTKYYCWIIILWIQALIPPLLESSSQVAGLFLIPTWDMKRKLLYHKHTLYVTGIRCIIVFLYIWCFVDFIFTLKEECLTGYSVTALLPMLTLSTCVRNLWNIKISEQCL